MAELASARQHQGELAGHHGARGGGCREMAEFFFAVDVSKKRNSAMRASQARSLPGLHAWLSRKVITSHQPSRAELRTLHFSNLRTCRLAPLNRLHLRRRGALISNILNLRARRLAPLN